jgi:hypothetical protein
MSEHLKELLRMAHEQLDSQAAMIETLSKFSEFQSEVVRDAEIEIAELEKKLNVTDELQSVLDFLLGIGDIEGYDFSEGPEDQGPYWWRSHLRKALKEDKQ